MGKRIIALFLLSACLLSLGAVGGRIIPIGDPLYTKMEDLYLISGRSGLQSSRPWSEGEARMMLDRLDFSSLNGIGQMLYRSIEEDLENRAYFLTPSLEVSPELYAHINSEDFCTDQYWAYGFNDRKPFASASVEAGIGPFYTYTELAYGYGRVTNKDGFSEVGDLAEDGFHGIGAIVGKDEDTLRIPVSSAVYSPNLMFNFPQVDMLEIDIPRRTSFTFSFDSITFGYLRDRLSWGRSKIGNFIFDDHVSRMDYLFLKLYCDRFSLDYIIYLPEVDYSNGNSNDFDGKTRIMLAHMLSFRILDNLSFSISENVMYSFTAAELAYFNPAMIFHNLNNSKTLNAIAHLELEYVPVNGLRLYTQFALDQATAPTEDDSQPMALGFNAGAEYAFAIDDSIISFFIEGSYTSPYLYRRNHVDFLVFNRYSINRPYGKFPIFTYLGFPYGGDSIALYAECGYRKIDSLSVTLSLLYLLHGEVSIMSPHSSSGNNNSAPDIKGNTPTGDAYHNLCISLDVRYPFSISIFDIEGFINAAYAMSREKADAQLSVGVSVRI